MINVQRETKALPAYSAQRKRRCADVRVAFSIRLLRFRRAYKEQVTAQQPKTR